MKFQRGRLMNLSGSESCSKIPRLSFAACWFVIAACHCVGYRDSCPCAVLFS
jgi:hypothetical protein